MTLSFIHVYASPNPSNGYKILRSTWVTQQGRKQATETEDFYVHISYL